MPRSFSPGKAVSSASIIAALGYTPLATTDLLRSYLDTTVTYNADDTLGDTALSVTVAAGGKYAISLMVQSTAAKKALLLDFAGTATFTDFKGTWEGLNSDNVRDFAFVTAAGTDFNPGAMDGAFSSLYTFTGSCTVNAGGTFLLRGCQNVSDASDTTILAGSTLTLTKMN